MFVSSGKIFLRNTAVPLCIKCVHFVEPVANYPYDLMPNDERDGRCKKFGEVDMVTGAIIHDFASECRINDWKCGKLASEFVDKTKFKGRL